MTNNTADHVNDAADISDNSVESRTKEETDMTSHETTDTNSDLKATPKTKYSKTAHIVIALLTWLFRIGLGATFIFSGVVKAIDPWGTVYKLHDYIAAMPDGLFTWAMPLLTVTAFVLFTAEILIGAVIITGSYRRIGAIGALLLMIIMLPLTLWIALKNPVADCGCFGDALIVSNWTTFWKNIALTVMAVWLTIFNKRARCLILPTLQWLLFAGTLLFAITIGFIGYNIQPMIDFRPYKVNDTLIDTDMPDDETDNLMAVWERNGVQITIPADSIPDGDDWTFVERAEMSDSSIQNDQAPKQEKGIAIFDGEEDITEDIVSAEGEEIIVFMTDLPHISSGNFYKLNSLHTYCNTHDVSMIAVVAATPLQIQDFIDHSMADYPIYTAEDTAIKEIVRGNPAIVYLKDGKIIWKSSLSAIPAYDFMESTPDKEGALADYAPLTDKNTFEYICLLYISFIALIIFLSHVPMVIRFTGRKLKKSKWVKDGAIVKIFLTVIACGCMLSSCNDDIPDSSTAEEEKTRSILVYMVGTNSLAKEIDIDIKEILQGYGQVKENAANILIYKASTYEETPSLYRVIKDQTGEASLELVKHYDKNTSSVSIQRIQNVIADFQSYAPAKEYGLFLCSHATSWIPTGVSANSPIKRAFGDDYGKSINVTDLAEAIPSGVFDFIWLDCCLMGNIEVAYQLRHDCNTLIAYPTEVLAGGVPYQNVLQYLLKKEISLTNAVYAMYHHYADNQDVRYQSCTISIINTDALEALASVARELLSNYSKDNDNIASQIYGNIQGVSLYDLYEVYSSFPANQENTKVLQLREALDKAIIQTHATPKFLNFTINPEHYSGISCRNPRILINTQFEDFYKSLDWYKDVYHTITP